MVSKHTIDNTVGAQCGRQDEHREGTDEKGEGVNQRSSFINDANSRLLNSRQLSLDSPRTFEEQGSLPSQKQPKIVINSIYAKGITTQENAQNTSKLSCGYSAIISYMPPLICICEDILQEQQ